MSAMLSLGAREMLVELLRGGYRISVEREGSSDRYGIAAIAAFRRSWYFGIGSKTDAYAMLESIVDEADRL